MAVVATEFQELVGAIRVELKARELLKADAVMGFILDREHVAADGRGQIMPSCPSVSAKTEPMVPVHMDVIEPERHDASP